MIVTPGTRRTCTAETKKAIADCAVAFDSEDEDDYYCDDVSASALKPEIANLKARISDLQEETMADAIERLVQRNGKNVELPAELLIEALNKPLEPSNSMSNKSYRSSPRF
ncbi:unnamed protein product [Cylindrotheca closterium]|uniref:Uncharacterized protein n=1 Tax=Cylindrotheca closterium TaxID=2856 RepID=A0AAD2FTG7_9STRA|nr:unnamed protein product [Cylindrotheca closterium]